MVVTAPQRSALHQSYSAPKRDPELSWRATPIWNRFTPLQLLVMGLAALPLSLIAVALVAGASGVVPDPTVRQVVLLAGENPGMLVFGAMFLASPVQWSTGRSQVRVRKYLGIVFYLLALSNGAMFLWEEGAGQLFSRPLVIVGLVSVLIATPLFMTSSRASQRLLGMRRWRVLHKLTYLVAIGLVVHVLMIPDPGPGTLMIIAGFVLRVPPIKHSLIARQKGRALQGASLQRENPQGVVTF